MDERLTPEVVEALYARLVPDIQHFLARIHAETAAYGPAGGHLLLLCIYHRLLWGADVNWERFTRDITFLCDLTIDQKDQDHG